MKQFQIRRILTPTDFSETAGLAVNHAAFMASLFKAELCLLHVIEITETTFSVYNPAVQVRSLEEVRQIVQEKLSELVKSIKKTYGVTVNTIISNGHATGEIRATVKDYDIDVVVMGTHGASGVGEHFIGSNAQRTVNLSPCPVITIHKRSAKAGFTNIILPIDGTLHSREKALYAIELARKYSSVIHVMGFSAEKDADDLKKLRLKTESVENEIKKAGLSYRSLIIEGNNLAVEALRYAGEVNGDLIILMADHESRFDGTLLGGIFGKQIVNHSDIPVMSIRPRKGVYESTSLSAASPY